MVEGLCSCKHGTDTEVVTYADHSEAHSLESDRIDKLERVWHEVGFDEELSDGEHVRRDVCCALVDQEGIPAKFVTVVSTDEEVFEHMRDRARAHVQDER